MIADWITSIAGNDPHLMMLLLVLLFTVVGDFIEPVPTIIIFMPLVNTLTQAGDINGVHMGVVLIATLAFGLITPPYGLVLLMASKFVGVQFCQGATGGAADLCGVPRDHHLHDLFPEGRAVAAEAGDPGIGRLLQVAGGDGVYLSELKIRSSPREGGDPVPERELIEERGVLDHPLRDDDSSTSATDIARSLKPERRAVAVVDPPAAERFRHRLHHGIVADEQDDGLRVTVEPSAAHFDLLVNFFTAARNSSVCMASMILSSSASSCCLVGVTAAW